MRQPEGGVLATITTDYCGRFFKLLNRRASSPYHYHTELEYHVVLAPRFLTTTKHIRKMTVCENESREKQFQNKIRFGCRCSRCAAPRSRVLLHTPAFFFLAQSVVHCKCNMTQHNRTHQTDRIRKDLNERHMCTHLLLLLLLHDSVKTLPLLDAEPHCHDGSQTLPLPQGSFHHTLNSQREHQRRHRESAPPAAVAAASLHQRLFSSFFFLDLDPLRHRHRLLLSAAPRPPHPRSHHHPRLYCSRRPAVHREHFPRPQPMKHSQHVRRARAAEHQGATIAEQQPGLLPRMSAPQRVAPAPSRRAQKETATTLHPPWPAHVKYIYVIM